MDLAGITQQELEKEANEFLESKIGVKGLADSGLTSIPRIFILPPEILSDLNTSSTRLESSCQIPIIDLSEVFAGRRTLLVDQIAEASREIGCFQIVNHGISAELQDGVIEAFRRFHDLPGEYKARWYGRENPSGVYYYSTERWMGIPISWRDSLELRMNSNPVVEENIPDVCRKEIIEWGSQVKVMGELLMELLSEGLGLDPKKLKDLNCSEMMTTLGHYYPYCPQPNLTTGTLSHTDPTVISILIQDHHGGLQLKHDGEWVDIKPIPGALIVFIGDLLQIISNDEYKSVIHRVLASSVRDARVSVANSFFPSPDDTLWYGPFQEISSAK